MVWHGPWCVVEKLALYPHGLYICLAFFIVFGRQNVLIKKNKITTSFDSNDIIVVYYHKKKTESSLYTSELSPFHTHMNQSPNATKMTMLPTKTVDAHNTGML